MSERRYRVLLIASHATQYGAAVFRRLARDPRLEILVAYCSLQGAEPGYDAGFGREIRWDVPLLDGHPWIAPRNRSPRPRLGHFWGLVNPGVWKLVRGGNYDAVVIYTGYRYATFWIALAAAKGTGTAVLFGTDAHELSARSGGGWKARLKGVVWPRLFRLADVAIVASTGGVGLMRSLGLPEGRIALTPYVVDNDWWTEAAARVDREAARARWRIPPEAPLAVFSAKLQPWKRPLDALEAFARADVPGSYLIFAGEGPLRGAVERAAARLGVAGRVRLLGFVNQSVLPEVYGAADVLVLPSEYEPFGVVVNEAMLCGCVPVVSDRVGARYDLVEEGRTGFVYPAGNVEKLAELLGAVLGHPGQRARIREAALERIAAWSPALNVDRLVGAVATAVAGQPFGFPAPRSAGGRRAATRRGAG